MMLELSNTILVCIDIQGNLAQAMHAKEDLFENLKKLISGSRILDIPIIWTEQIPQKLGTTIPEIAERMPDITPISKISFSCCGNEKFMQALKAANCKQVLIAGIEAHVCVYQTAVELISMGYEVQIITDCVSSRRLENKTIGLEKTKDAGAALTTTETVLFELLRTAAAPKFKEIVRIVK